MSSIQEENQGNPLDPQEWVEPPSEFESAALDLVGYWESASPPTPKRGPTFGSPPVEFTPLHVTLTDSDLDPSKTSTLIHCRLEKPCLLKSATKGEGYIEFPAGSLFGIWAKPGMRPLKKLAGNKVWMRNGQKIRGEIVYYKDISKPGDKLERTMVVYDIRWSKDATERVLQVMEDHRDESLPDAEQQRRARKQARATERANSDSDIDFDDLPF